MGFISDGVRPGAVVRTDGWKGSDSLCSHGYDRQRTTLAASESPAHVLMPAVHRVASQLKRCLLGTHQGAVQANHLQGYLNEFALRFNRRRSKFRASSCGVFWNRRSTWGRSPIARSSRTPRRGSCLVGMTFAGTGLAPVGTLRLSTAHRSRYKHYYREAAR